MSFDDINKQLFGSRAASLKFEDVGDSHEGTLTDADVKPQTNTAGEVQTFPDGREKTQLVLTLATKERDAAKDDDDGSRVLYTSWRMERQIRDAAKAAGAEGLEEGGWIKVTFVGEEKVKAPAGVPGGGKAKLYEVEYKKPALVAFDGKGTQLDAPKEEAWSKDQAELVATMSKNGIASGIIAQATGLSIDQVNSLIVI